MAPQLLHMEKIASSRIKNAVQANGQIVGLEGLTDRTCHSAMCVCVSLDGPSSSQSCCSSSTGARSTWRLRVCSGTLCHQRMHAAPPSVLSPWRGAPQHHAHDQGGARCRHLTAVSRAGWQRGARPVGRLLHLASASNLLCATHLFASHLCSQPNRVDVVTDAPMNVIASINDLEKDPAYARWPRSLGEVGNRHVVRFLLFALNDPVCSCSSPSTRAATHPLLATCTLWWPPSISAGGCAFPHSKAVCRAHRTPCLCTQPRRPADCCGALHDSEPAGASAHHADLRG